MSAVRSGAQAVSDRASSVGPESVEPVRSVATVSSDVTVSAVGSAESVAARADALASALGSGVGRLPAGGVDRAAGVIEKVSARTSIAGGHTIVALAGATGSGKSSLFNSLVGVEVARIGARRPTTSAPTAAVWGTDSPVGLLDWLKVEACHMVVPFEAPGTGPGPWLELDGLVLLDLPDFDSLETTHRDEVDRLLDLVDVFVWVTDPQKYADARLHEDYIARLSTHDAITMVVLNQADRLTPEGLAACRTDLIRLLAADGVVDPEVIPTSATDGSGVINLHHRIKEVLASRNASVRRLDSDLRSAATVLRSAVADSEPRLDDHSDLELVDALTRAAGIPVILDAVELDFRRATWARTGWPFTRLARALRPAPLKLLRLNRGASGGSGGISESDVRSVLGRSSLPPATPAARSAVELATRDLGNRAAQGLPQAWTDAVTDAATPPGEALADALDKAVLDTPLRAPNPLWWAGFGVMQWVFAVDAVLSLIWLGVVAVLRWLHVRVDVPVVTELGYPIVLLAGSLVVGLLLSLLARAIGRVGGRRRKVLVEARLRETVAKVANDRLVAPVQSVLDCHRATREHLEAALRQA